MEENLDRRLKWRETYAREVAEEKEVEEIGKRVREKQAKVDTGSGLGGCSASGTRAGTPSLSSAAASPPKPFSAFLPKKGLLGE